MGRRLAPKYMTTLFIFSSSSMNMIITLPLCRVADAVALCRMQNSTVALRGVRSHDTRISRGEVCFWLNPPSRAQHCRQRRSRAARAGAWVCFAIGRRSGPDAKQGKLRAGRCLEPRKTCSAWWPRPPRSCGDDQRPPARSEGTGERPPHPRSIQHEGWVDERRGSHR